MGIAEAEGIDTRENRAFAFIPSIKVRGFSLVGKLSPFSTLLLLCK